MAEKLIIEVFKEKKAEDFTSAIASPECRAASGSAAAYSAAMAAALLGRAARICAEKDAANERVAYIVRNSEILRSYMVQLIDESVKAKGPLRRAKKDGDERGIEASLQMAACIESEIVNMMKPCLEFISELCGLCPKEDAHLLAEAAELALCASRVSISVILSYSAQSGDETFRYVTKRENEVFLAEQKELYEGVAEKLKQ